MQCLSITWSYAFSSEVFSENSETGKNLISERCNSLKEEYILLQIKVSENYG